MVVHDTASQNVGWKKYHQCGYQHGIAHLRTGGGSDEDAIPEESAIGDHGDHHHPEEVRFGIFPRGDAEKGPIK